MTQHQSFDYHKTQKGGNVMTTLLQQLETRPKLEMHECAEMDARRKDASCSQTEKERIEEEMFRSVIPMAYKFAHNVCMKMNITGDAAEDVQSEAIGQVVKAIERYDGTHDSKSTFGTLVYNYLWRWSVAATQKHYDRNSTEISTDYGDEEIRTDSNLSKAINIENGSEDIKITLEATEKLMQEVYAVLQESLSEEDFELVQAKFSEEGKTWKEVFEMSSYTQKYKGRYPEWSFEHNIKAKLRKMEAILAEKGITLEKLLDNVTR